MRISRLDPSEDLTETGWVVRRVAINKQVDHIAYHTPSSCYILAVSESVQYTDGEKDSHTLDGKLRQPQPI